MDKRDDLKNCCTNNSARAEPGRLQVSNPIISLFGTTWTLDETLNVGYIQTTKPVGDDFLWCCVFLW